MNYLDLIELQVHLEYQTDGEGLLVAFEGSNEQAYYQVYQYREGYIPYGN
jgi:hypothetical protein